MHAGAGGVEGELADGNAHAVRAEIPETENALAIGDDDDGHVRPATASCGGWHECGPDREDRCRVPRGRRKMWEKRLQASPTVGV